MKNLKKVLAMVLAFACTFTMFAGAKVFEDVPAGSDYSEAITMLSDLGIIQGKDDGKYHPEDTITRAEACAMIARLMTGDPNVSQYTGAQNFADVAKGSWKDSAIGYCYINNIVVGVGNNKFEPDRAITDAEFITMVVRAMGYETPDMTQGYPFSYMSNAQAIGLLDGVNMVASTDALRGEDAQVIYNAMFTDYARGAMLVNTTHGTSVETYPTLAESVWGLDRAAVGTWTGKDDEEATLTNCKAHTWVVIGADPTEADHILAYPIDDDTTDLYDSDEKNAYRPYSFKYEGDAESVKGYQVELWGEGSHGEATWEKGDNKFVYSEDWTIKAIKTVKGQTKYDYNPSMADSKPENGTIVLDETSLDLDTAAANASKVNVRDGGAIDLFVANNNSGDKKYNGVKISSDETLEEALNVRDGAQYQLMDWDGDGEIDWVVADQASYYKVESVTSSRVIVSSMSTKDGWETSTDSVKDTWKIGSLNDGKIDGHSYKIKYEGADSLKEGDIIEVAYGTPSYDKGEKAEVVNATVSVIDAESKSLDKVSTKDGLTLTFDDTEIKVAQNEVVGNVIVPANPEKYKDFNSEELGTDFDLYLNRNGFIVYSDYTTETANYAMVLDAADGADRVGDRNLAKVDLLTGDNKHLKDVELTSNASVSNNAYTSSDRHIDETKMVGNVYKYWTNDDGEITRMTQVIDTADALASSQYEYDADADRLIDTSAGSKYVASLEEANVIFAVKEHAEAASAGYTLNNKGYIKVQTNNTDATVDYYVDVDDVLAVKQADIPDINTGANSTHAAELDNEATDGSRKATWLDNTAANPYRNKFIAAIDKNGDASAAILGVDSFNKFGGGNTKIGLVTDVTYSNSSDGKYVELSAAFGGENKTIASAKKVDFDDIVNVYDSRTGTDVAVGSETATINYNNASKGGVTTTASTGLYQNTSLDKALEKSAAYAEITTDADGNLTKVVFLDEAYNSTASSGSTAVYDVNKVVGHYYNVSRNVTMESNGKRVDYLLNDGSAQSALGGVTYTAAQVYADNSNLYSINYLAKQSDGLDSEAKFYEIDGKPTLNGASKSDYKGKQMSVVNGFNGTPEITVSDDYGSIGTSSIDEDSLRDAYEVSDIAFKNNGGDIIAVYSFKDELGEVDGSTLTNSITGTVSVPATSTWTNVADLSLFNGATFQITSQPYTKQSNGATSLVTGLSAQLTDGVTTNASTLVGTNVKVQINATHVVAAGTYYVDVRVTDHKGNVQNLTYSFTVGAVNSNAVVDSAKVTASTANTVTVEVKGSMPQASTRVAGPDPITNLLASNFKVADLSGKTYDVLSAVQTGTNTGVYMLTVDDTLTGKTVVVTVTTSASVVDAVKVDTDFSAAGAAADDTNTTVANGDNTTDLKVTVKDSSTGNVTGLTADDFIVKVNGQVVDAKVDTTDATNGNYAISVDGVDLTKQNVEIYVGNVVKTVNGGDSETPSTAEADTAKGMSSSTEDIADAKGYSVVASDGYVYFKLYNKDAQVKPDAATVSVLDAAGFPVDGVTVAGVDGVYRAKLTAGNYKIQVGESKVDLEVISQGTMTLAAQEGTADGVVSISGTTGTIKYDLLNAADVKLDVTTKGMKTVEVTEIGTNLTDDVAYADGVVTLTKQDAEVSSENIFKVKGTDFGGKTVEYTITVTVSKATKPTLSSAEATATTTIDVTVDSYATLSAGMKAALADKANWTVDQSGAKTIKSVSVNEGGGKVTITLQGDSGVTLDNSTAINVKFGTTLNSSGIVNGEATVQDANT